MRIRIGLTQPSFVWEQYLRQEGVPYAIMDPEGEVTPEQFSALVVNRSLTGGESEVVEHYVREGGAVLGFVRFLRSFCPIQAEQESLEYIVGEGKEPFENLMLADLGAEGELPREATALRTQQNAYAVGLVSRGRGTMVLLPFDPAGALGDHRAAVKNFYSRVERLPSERVSLTAKGEVRHLLHCALEFLHISRGMPYAHLWYYPGKAQNMFGFRVDTDFARKSEIDDLYGVARAHSTGLTWFVDVRSHESLLPHFASMLGQEVGVHCYDHRVDESDESNRANFGRARRLLEEAGFRVEGFAAPFGIWNPSVARVTDELGFVYSSEFSWAYDTLPAQPALEDRLYRALQVPIHPICIGSLRKVGYSEQQMTEYFALMVEWKLARREPLIFYHHPSHGHPAVVDALLSAAGNHPIPRMTFAEYARWWRGRVAMEISVQGGAIDLELPVEEAESYAGLSLRIVRTPGREALADIAPRIVLDRLEWSDRPACPPPEDLRRIREFDPRRVLGDLYSRMTRRIR